MAEQELDGALGGGASLDPKSFAAIVKGASRSSCPDFKIFAPRQIFSDRRAARKIACRCG
jgi:Triosephosphate isomerase